MKRLDDRERDVILRHLEDNKFQFAIPIAPVNFFWAKLKMGCLGSFYRPDIIKLPLWYYKTSMSLRGVKFVSDMIDLLPTIGHELIHMKQFIDNPIGYMFKKNRLIARWTIEPEAKAEEERIRAILGNEEHNQENYG